MGWAEWAAAATIVLSVLGIISWFYRLELLIRTLRKDNRKERHDG